MTGLLSCTSAFGTIAKQLKDALGHVTCHPSFCQDGWLHLTAMTVDMWEHVPALTMHSAGLCLIACLYRSGASSGSSSSPGTAKQHLPPVEELKVKFACLSQI